MRGTNLKEKPGSDFEDGSDFNEREVDTGTPSEMEEQFELPAELLDAQVLEKTGDGSYNSPKPPPSNQGKLIIYELDEVKIVRINGEDIEVPSFKAGFVVENPTNIVFIVPEGEYKHGGAKDENNILEVHPFAMTMGEIAMEGRSKTFLCILKDENRGVDLIQNLKDAGAEIVKVEHESKKDKTKATMEVNVSSLKWFQPKGRFSNKVELHTKAGETWLAPDNFRLDDFSKVIKAAPVAPPSLG
ncbi:MAG: hypothetical protein PHW76_05385 [Alphaproteobacteria bacterium]|nr:hypothetical protein [Alphaproteobacteria bacterium]